MNPTITIAQIEIFPSDISRNSQKIIDTIESHGDKSDFIIFPELTISGYTCGENFEKEYFIDDCNKAVDEIKTVSKKYPNCCIIFGSPTFCENPKEKNGTIRLYNSALVLINGEIIGQYNKTLLANDYHHEDRKYFQPGSKFLILEHAGIKFSVLICEDIWRDDHDRDLIGEIKTIDPDVSHIFTLNFSYFTYKKQEARHKLLKELSKYHHVTIVYVNAVGLGDLVKNIILYDGNSLVYTNGNYIKSHCYEFEEKIGWLFPGSDPLPENRFISIWTAMLYARKATFKATNLKPIVLLSGGLDSNIVAVQCVKALGAENCIFISCPSVHNGEITKSNAQIISDKLGVELHWVPIDRIVANTMLPFVDEDYEPNKYTLATSTAEAISRSLIGLVACNLFGGALIATGNHTEEVLGWSSFHDPGSIGIDKPLGDLTKEELCELSRVVNEAYSDDLILPDLFNGKIKPMAELADSNTDPFDYKIYSGICASIIRDRASAEEMIAKFKNKTLSDEYFLDLDYVYSQSDDVFRSAVFDAVKRVKKSTYKTAQGAPIWILSPRSRGFSSREPLYNYYRDR